jgi:hypothetical protein
MTKSEFLLQVYKSQRKHGMKPNIILPVMFLLAANGEMKTPRVTDHFVDCHPNRRSAHLAICNALRCMERQGWTKAPVERHRPIPRTWSLSDAGTALVLDALASPPIPFPKPQAVAV